MASDQSMGIAGEGRKLTVPDLAFIHELILRMHCDEDITFLSPLPGNSSTLGSRGCGMGKVG